MRVAFFSPLPPERTGIGDYSFELLEELRHLVEVTAVVSDDLAWSARAPEGVPVIGASEARYEEFDCSVYQMGNNPTYHRFLFRRAFDEPGLLVLHDPSLGDFMAEMCGGAESSVFRDEVAYDRPSIGPDDDLPLVDAGGGRIDLDRLEVLLARRIVESNVRTLVHSSAMAREMRARYPGNDIVPIQLPARLIPEAPRSVSRRPGEVVFGVFGGINYYKRILPIVEAFLDVRRRHPACRMVVAGRSDDRLLEAQIRRIAARPELEGALEVKTNLELAELEREMSRCDVGISLRWPTAGEMSATLMRTLGAGRPAIVSDVLQFRELDPTYCWRVTTDFDGEHDALVALMDAAAADPERCRVAGEVARRFVETEATYAVVARRYLEHIEHCARERAGKRARRRALLLDPERSLGVNLFAPSWPCEASEAARRSGAALSDAGVDVVTIELAPPEGWVEPDRSWLELDEDRTGPEATIYRLSGPGAGELSPKERVELDRALLAVAEGAVDRADVSIARRGPHPVDLYFVDGWQAERIGRLARLRRARGRRVVADISPEFVPLTPAHQLILEVAEQVWVPSEHAAEVVGMSTAKEVVVVPWPAAFPARAAGGGGPAAKGPGPGEAAGEDVRRSCTFLVVVPPGTTVARSNPLAAVDAFRVAFPRHERGKAVRLVVVLGDAAGRREARDVLSDAVGFAGGLFLEDPSPPELRALLESCDVHVSLHRSGGFGLWVADALALGKPVVATGWAGVLDRADPRACCRVGYSVREVAEADGFLDPGIPFKDGRGCIWVEADADAAARWMRRLAADPGLRKRVGAEGAAFASAHLSASRSAAAARSALSSLLARRRTVDAGNTAGASEPVRVAT